MSKVRFVSIALSFVCVMLFSFSEAAASNEGGIFISEVMWNGSSSSTADEWIELHNSGSNIIDLTNYSLFDSVKNQEMVKITEGQIAPYGYFLISNNSKDHLFTSGESVLDTVPDIVDSSISLSNSNFKLSLLDSNGVTIDVAGDGNKPFTYQFKKSSMYRSSYDLPGDNSLAWSVYQGEVDGSCLEASNIDLDGGVSGLPKACATPRSSGRPIIKSLSQSQTKFQKGTQIQFDISFEIEDDNNDLDHYELIDSSSGNKYSYDIQQKSILLAKSSVCPKLEIVFFDLSGLSTKRELETFCFQLSDSIWISEILPHPKVIDFDGSGQISSDDEFIEIVNSGEESVDLSGWYLKDKSGKKYVFGEGEIKPLQYLVIYKGVSGISINDTGDEVGLYTPLGHLIENISIAVSSSKADISYSKWGGRWFWSKTATPGRENIINEIGSIKNPSIYEIQEANNKEVEITAEIIGVERSGFAVTYQGAAIDVAYNLEAAFSRGQKVTITGKITGGRFFKMFASKVTIGSASGSESSAQTDGEAIIAPSVNTLAEETIKRIITKRIVSKKNITAAILGASTVKDMMGDPLIISRYMIYLSGVFSFLLVILIYEFCCRR